MNKKEELVTKIEQELKNNSIGVNSMELLIAYYKNKYPKTYQNRLLDALKKTDIEFNQDITQYLIDLKLYIIIAKYSSPSLIEKIITEKNLLNCDLSNYKDQDFLKQFICPRVLKILAKRNKHLDSTALNYLEEAFNEYELKELVNNTQSLFDYLIENYSIDKIIDFIPITNISKREIKSEINKANYSFIDIKESQEIYYLINELIEALQSDDKSLVFLIDSLLINYNKGINNEEIISFIKLIIKLKKQNPNFEIELNNLENSSYFSQTSNLISLADIDVCNDKTIFHELIHFIHFNEYNNETPLFYQSIKEYMKKSIQYKNKAKKLIMKLCKKYQSMMDKTLEKMSQSMKDRDLENIKRIAKTIYLTYSNTKEINQLAIKQIFLKIVFIRYQLKCEYNPQRNYINMLDSILEGSIYSGDYNNQDGKKITNIGHERAYFESDARNSFVEFLAYYLSVKLTHPNYHEFFKSFYQIIGATNTKELEEYTDIFIKVRKKNN